MHDDPLLPDEVTGEELDADARTELRTLPKELATKVARHLVMAGQLAEEDPERAYKHARTARRLASRVGVVREAAGIAAYHAGEWAEALAELRAARRLSAGDESYLPVMADCERGLGRPERALELIKSPEAENLDPMGRVELRIVESGVRRDLGQYDAAVVTLQIPELRDRRLRPWSARLFYAYADALAEEGREAEASDWFARAAAADRDGETDAAERYAELEGLHIVDTEEDGLADADAAQDDLAETAAAQGEAAQDNAAEADAAQTAAAQGDTKRGDAAQAAAVQGGVAEVDAAEPDVAQPDVAQPDAGQPDAGQPDAGQPDAGQTDAGQGDVAQGDVAQGDGAEGDAAQGDAPAGDVSEGDAPAGEGSAGVDAAGSASGDEAAARGVPATGIEFKAAEAETPEVPEDGAPDAPAVFLEPKPADEGPPSTG
ncbi:hypothetical protein ACN3XK_34175 [Actinomadura welshii]